MLNFGGVFPIELLEILQQLFYWRVNSRTSISSGHGFGFLGILRIPSNMVICRFITQVRGHITHENRGYNPGYYPLTKYPEPLSRVFCWFLYRDKIHPTSPRKNRGSHCQIQMTALDLQSPSELKDFLFWMSQQR